MDNSNTSQEIDKTQTKKDEDSPPPSISENQIFRMLNNLDYGRTVELANWNLPELEARSPDQMDLELAVRLTDAFYHAIDAGGEYSGSGLWDTMSKMFHGTFISALEVRDHEQIAQTLSGMFYSPIATGICARAEDINTVKSDPMAKLQTVDVIASLGMALGIVKVPNPALADPPECIGNQLRRNIRENFNFFRLDYRPAASWRHFWNKVL